MSESFSVGRQNWPDRPPPPLTSMESVSEAQTGWKSARPGELEGKTHGHKWTRDHEAVALITARAAQQAFRGLPNAQQLRGDLEGSISATYPPEVEVHTVEVLPILYDTQAPALESHIYARATDGRIVEVRDWDNGLQAGGLNPWNAGASWSPPPALGYPQAVAADPHLVDEALEAVAFRMSPEDQALLDALDLDPVKAAKEARQREERQQNPESAISQSAFEAYLPQARPRSEERIDQLLKRVAAAAERMERGQHVKLRGGEELEVVARSHPILRFLGQMLKLGQPGHNAETVQTLVRFQSNMISLLMHQAVTPDEKRILLQDVEKIRRSPFYQEALQMGDVLIRQGDAALKAILREVTPSPILEAHLKNLADAVQHLKDNQKLRLTPAGFIAIPRSGHAHGTVGSSPASQAVFAECTFLFNQVEANGSEALKKKLIPILQKLNENPWFQEANANSHSEHEPLFAYVKQHQQTISGPEKARLVSDAIPNLTASQTLYMDPTGNTTIVSSRNRAQTIFGESKTGNELNTFNLLFASFRDADLNYDYETRNSLFRSMQHLIQTPQYQDAVAKSPEMQAYAIFLNQDSSEKVHAFIESKVIARSSPIFVWKEGKPVLVEGKDESPQVKLEGARMLLALAKLAPLLPLGPLNLTLLDSKIQSRYARGQEYTEPFQEIALEFKLLGDVKVQQQNVQAYQPLVNLWMEESPAILQKLQQISPPPHLQIGGTSLPLAAFVDAVSFNAQAEEQKMPFLNQRILEIAIDTFDKEMKEEQYTWLLPRPLIEELGMLAAAPYEDHATASTRPPTQAEIRQRFIARLETFKGEIHPTEATWEQAALRETFLNRVLESLRTEEPERQGRFFGILQKMRTTLTDLQMAEMVDQIMIVSQWPLDEFKLRIREEQFAGILPRGFIQALDNIETMPYTDKVTEIERPPRQVEIRERLMDRFQTLMNEVEKRIANQETGLLALRFTALRKQVETIPTPYEADKQNVLQSLDKVVLDRTHRNSESFCLVFSELTHFLNRVQRG